MRQRVSATKPSADGSTGGFLRPGDAAVARADETGNGRTNALRVVLARVDNLLGIARRLKARANTTAVAAEAFEQALRGIRAAVRQAEAITGDADRPSLVAVRARPRTPDDSVLKRLARHSPMESLVWSTADGRHSIAIVNDTRRLRLSRRLAALLDILHARPLAPDGLGGFIGYKELRKEVMAREGRRLRPHALSQSLSLLAGALEAQGLNPFWLERDPREKRVRLLIRKAAVSAATGLADPA